MSSHLWKQKYMLFLHIFTTENQKNPVFTTNDLPIFGSLWFHLVLQKLQQLPDPHGAAEIQGPETLAPEAWHGKLKVFWNLKSAVEEPFWAKSCNTKLNQLQLATLKSMSKYQVIQAAKWPFHTRSLEVTYYITIPKRSRSQNCQVNFDGWQRLHAASTHGKHTCVILFMVQKSQTTRDG